jgi:hypothetical protein
MSSLLPRILFCSYHRYLDPSNGAALATRDLLELFTSRGWTRAVLPDPNLISSRVPRWKGSSGLKGFPSSTGRLARKSAAGGWIQPGSWSNWQKASRNSSSLKPSQNILKSIGFKVLWLNPFVCQPFSSVAVIGKFKNFPKKFILPVHFFLQISINKIEGLFSHFDQINPRPPEARLFHRPSLGPPLGYAGEQARGEVP